VYKDNLPRIMGVELETKRKNKDVTIVGFVDSRQPFSAMAPEMLVGIS
jgi:hypothetical protein